MEPHLSRHDVIANVPRKDCFRALIGHLWRNCVCWNSFRFSLFLPNILDISSFLNIEKQCVFVPSYACGGKYAILGPWFFQIFYHKKDVLVEFQNIFQLLLFVNE